MAKGITKKSKSALFLIELMIAILFFSLASAVCAQLFAKAHLISQKSGDITMAVNRAQSAAEAFKASQQNTSVGEPLEEMQYFDADWNETAATGAVYELMLSAKDNGQLLYADITVLRIGNTEPIYTLQTGKPSLDGERILSGSGWVQ